MSLHAPTATVSAIGQINISGNVIPSTWWGHVRLPSGKPDSTAIVLLSEIVYWYRPAEIRDEFSGEIKGLRKRFHGDKLQRSYQAFADQFGFSKREATDALKRLREAGIITLELRTINTLSGAVNNVLYVEPVAAKIRQITSTIAGDLIEKEPENDTTFGTGVTLKRNSPYVETEQGLRQDVIAPTLKRKTNTETTTENTTEIKTTHAPANAGTPVPEKKRTGDYSEEFEHVWAEYPRREGSNPKNKAYQAWSARRKDGVPVAAMLEGTRRYMAFCQNKGQVGTSYVMQAARFFGPNREFENDWVASVCTSTGGRPPIGNFAGQSYGTSNYNWGKPQ